MYDNRRYVIMAVTDVTQDVIDCTLVDSTSTMRKSVDGTQAVISYEGAKPNCLIGYVAYDHDSIRSILSGENWTQSVE